MTEGRYPQVRTLRDVAAFRDRLESIGCGLPVDPVVAPDGPLSAALRIGDRELANRWAILPMEGWDGTLEGAPTEFVTRRWRRFGESGAALIWGGEAVAVRHDGRANPRQLRIGTDTVGGLCRLRHDLISARAARFGSSDGLLVGLQLTHSGRWSRPDADGRPKPRTAVRNALLDGQVGITDDRALLSDAELEDLVVAFIDAARLAREAGFDFVDIKACHGYLMHELLSAVDRPGRYGGDIAARSQMLLSIVTAVRSIMPIVGVRLSLFDVAGPEGAGMAFRPEDSLWVASRLDQLGVSMLCATGGSPYWCPHAQRPAYFPASDGYDPPEDPLLGVARHVAAAAELKRQVPTVAIVASGLSYLQELLPNVGQALVAAGSVDVVGIGRMALAYPDLPADVLAGRGLDRKHLCRTFSDCTTAPRNGLISGCWPLDPFFRDHPDRVRLAAIKRGARRG
jgi:2,4-dienoyl-CoA reductase-like NADH-dependent reductase (Old Yellow Enzyme family)